MRKKLECKSFIENKILTNLKTNKAKDYLLYFQNIQEYSSNCYRKNVMLLNLKNEETLELKFSFEVDDFYFEKENIILKEIKNNKTNIYRYTITSKKVIKISTIPFELGDFIIANENIYFLTEIQKYNENNAFKCSTNSPFFIENKGVKGDRMTGLFKGSLDAKNILLLSSLDISIDQIDFDKENNRIVFNARKNMKLKSIVSYLYIYEIQAEELKILIKGDYRISRILSFNKETIVFWGIDLLKKSRNENQGLMIIDCETRKVHSVKLSIDYSSEHPSIVTDTVFYEDNIMQKYKNDIYIKLVKRNKESIYRITLDGLVEEIKIDATMINEYIVSDKGIYYIGLKEQKLQEIYFKNKKLTNHNTWLKKYHIVQPKKIKFIRNKEEYDGWVLSPRNIEEGKKYPGILVIHGGPKMMYSSVISFDLQLLAAEGNFVFYMNPSGSDGRGDAFSNIRDKFASVPYEELMCFVDFIIEKHPEIDKNRLGITGGSYGGYMTNYIIGQTDRFKAAVSERGISNLMTAFTSSDIGHEFIYEYMGNHDTPWNNKMVYIKNSPIYYADRIKTPTLFIHGEMDYRCHNSESLNMFNALNYHGVLTKFCLFSNESHSLSVKGKPISKYKRYQELLNWFRKHL